MIAGPPAIDKPGKQYQLCTVINGRQGISWRSIQLSINISYIRITIPCSQQHVVIIIPPGWPEASLLSQSASKCLFIISADK